MDYIALITLIVGLGFLVIGVWFSVCNRRTYDQRINLITWIYSDPAEMDRRHKLYEQVKYEQHLWRLITFRDPRKLYKFD